MFLDLGYFDGKKVLTGNKAYNFFPDQIQQLHYHLYQINHMFIGAYSMELRTPQESKEAVAGFYSPDFQQHYYTDGWHQDNGARIKEYIVLWSNIWPTEIRHKKTKKLVEVEISHIVMFDNSKYEHRPPRKAALCKHRWFSRMFVVLKRKPWKR